MIANDYAILERAVEDGIESALHRFNKHEVEFVLPLGLADELSESIMSSAIRSFSSTSEKSLTNDGLRCIIPSITAPTMGDESEQQSTINKHKAPLNEEKLDQRV